MKAVVWLGLLGTTFITLPPLLLADPLRNLTVLYTNDTRGYLQACGCNRTGLGGLDRRATLIQRTREEGTPLLVLDSGNLADEPDLAQVILKAMAVMGYDAVGVGSLDLKIVDAFCQEAVRMGVPVCVSPPRPEWLPEFIPPVYQVEMGGMQVGIAALAPTAPEVSDHSLWVAVEPTLRKLRGRSDLVLVLSQGGLTRDRALVQQQAREGLIDLLIGNTEARSLTAPEVIGRTWLLPTTDRGQEVGQVDVTLTAAGPQLAWRRTPLDRTFPPEPAVEGIVGEYYAIQAQRLLDASVVGRLDPAKPPGTDPESVVGRGYVTAEKCAACHQPQYEQWLTQKHAHAVETLAAKQRLVRDCLPCHSEQYRRTGRFVLGLGKADGVQCSTCHGEGVVHSLLERKDRIEGNPGVTLCIRCHDEDRDPGFDYVKALESLRHWN